MSTIDRSSKRSSSIIGATNPCRISRRTRNIVPAAIRSAQLGQSVVLIDEDRVGGTCLHRGCIPTKALLHAGEIADQAREAEQFGVNATFHGIDMGGVHKYKDGVIGKNWKGLQGLITSRGIKIVEGEGTLEALVLTPGVTDVAVNGDGSVWVDRGEGLVADGTRFEGPAQVRAFAVRLAGLAGRRLDDSAPFVDGLLPGGAGL